MEILFLWIHGFYIVFFYSNSWRYNVFANGNEMRDGRVLNIYEQFTRVSHLAYCGFWLGKFFSYGLELKIEVDEKFNATE